MNKRGMSRAEIAAQSTRHCIALALIPPPPPPLFSISTILISCYATVPKLSFFQSCFVVIIFIAFWLSPQFIVWAHLLLSLSFALALGSVLCCSCLLPLPSSIFVYGIWLLLPSLFYPTSHKVSLSSIFPLPLHPYFLAVFVASSFIHYHPPPPMPYSL